MYYLTASKESGICEKLSQLVLSQGLLLSFSQIATAVTVRLNLAEGFAFKIIRWVVRRPYFLYGCGVDISISYHKDCSQGRILLSLEQEIQEQERESGDSRQKL